MSYGEAVLERGAGRRYRWKGRPGLPHKAIKNGACLGDGMAREAPAEMGGFASSAPSARSGGEGALEGLQLLEGTLCPPPQLLSFALPPRVLFLAAGGSGRMEAVMGKVLGSRCSSLLFSSSFSGDFGGAWGQSWCWLPCTHAVGAPYPWLSVGGEWEKCTRGGLEARRRGVGFQFGTGTAPNC